MVTPRQLAEGFLAIRSRIANIAGKTFGGRRDSYKTLGYQRNLFVEDYRARFKRNEVANRIVKAFPAATWRGGCDVIENKDPNTVTPFEQAFIDLDARIKIWDRLKRVDILSGIGRYGVLVIGAPGDMSAPLVSVSGPNDIAYLQPYGEDDAKVDTYDIEYSSPRFGLPMFYSLKRTDAKGVGSSNTVPGVAKRVHWSRCIHVSDGLLDDNIFSDPRLECVWNRLDDLEKVVGAGAEAFWRRADRGMQLELDPTLDVSVEEKAALKTQLQEYEHDLRRTLLTRGVDIKELGSDVADFKSPVEAIMSLISTGTGIPQRVLMGSEQGKLAAKQDRANWDNRVMDRQKDYAAPCMVRPLVDRFIELGALPTPKSYEVRFSSITTMDDEQRAETAKGWASLNRTAGTTVVTANEIRERVLDLPPLKEVLSDEPGSTEINAAVFGPGAPGGGTPGGKPVAEDAKPPVKTEDEPPTPEDEPRAAGKGGAAPWKHVHQAADRFRPASKEGLLEGLRRRKAAHEHAVTQTRLEGQGRGRGTRASQ